MRPTAVSKEDMEIIEEMLDCDFIVKMPPKRRYRVLVHVRSITKGEPRLDGCCKRNRKR